MIYFKQGFFQYIEKDNFVICYVKFLEEFGDVEGMEFFVGELEHTYKLLFLKFDFDGVEEWGKVVLEGKLFEDEEFFEAVEEDTGCVSQSNGQTSLHFKYYLKVELDLWFLRH